MLQGLGMSARLICKTSKAPGKTLTSVKYQQRTHRCVYISSASFLNILQETIFFKKKNWKPKAHAPRSYPCLLKSVESGPGRRW